MPVDLFSVESPEMVIVPVSIAKNGEGDAQVGRAQQLRVSVFASVDMPNLYIRLQQFNNVYGFFEEPK